MLKIKKNALKYKDTNGTMQDTGILFSQTGGSGTSETDTTLTQAGVPADAKATGDRIIQFAQDINSEITGLNTRTNNLSEEIEDLKTLLVDGNGVEY